MGDFDRERIENALRERREVCDKMASLSLDESRTMTNKMYAEWILNGNYEKDMYAFGFAGPEEIAELMSQCVPAKSSRLLDCASGTGLVGQELKQRGFLVLDALDASKECLDYSRRKGVYTKYICAHLGPNRLPIDDDTYDGICMSASLGNVHVRPDCFPELIRITKSGGYIILCVREEVLQGGEFCGNGKLDGILHKMAAKGCWEYLMKKRGVYMQSGLDGKVEFSYILVMRVL